MPHAPNSPLPFVASILWKTGLINVYISIKREARVICIETINGTGLHLSNVKGLAIRPAECNIGRMKPTHGYPFN